MINTPTLAQSFQHSFWMQGRVFAHSLYSGKKDLTRYDYRNPETFDHNTQLPLWIKEAGVNKISLASYLFYESLFNSKRLENDIFAVFDGGSQRMDLSLQPLYFFQKREFRLSEGTILCMADYSIIYHGFLGPVVCKGTMIPASVKKRLINLKRRKVFVR